MDDSDCDEAVVETLQINTEVCSFKKFHNLLQNPDSIASGLLLLFFSTSRV